MYIYIYIYKILCIHIHIYNIIYKYIINVCALRCCVLSSFYEEDI